jgi:hypothetical protein
MKTTPINKIWMIALGLLGSGLMGCHHSAPSVFRQPVSAHLPSFLSLTLLSPHAGERVKQFGTEVRFQIEGDLPPESRPVVYVQDGTGLSGNWWPTVLNPTGDGEYHQMVQFGEPGDETRRFRIVVQILREVDCPRTDTVGALPSAPLARSEMIEVFRE